MKKVNNIGSVDKAPSEKPKSDKEKVREVAYSGSIYTEVESRR